jgi:gliding motility-associated-like protein
LITTATGSDIFYTLERQQSGTDDWDELETINMGPNTVHLFEDSLSLNTDIFTYEYRAIVRNICDDIIDTTNIAVTILLTGFSYNDRLVNALQWSHYQGWDVGINEYIIYRTIGLEGVEEELTRVGGNITYYEDDVSTLNFSPGDFTYRIEAVSIASAVYPGIYSASSNAVRLTLQPIVWVPNAFVVDGFNTTFRPIISFANFEEYRMIIYSKWGDVIFDTTDINEAWDGFMNGEPVQEGVYVYFITIEDGKGKPVEYRGTVLLLSNRDQ